MPTPLELAESAFSEIRESFPGLTFRTVHEPDDGLDLGLEIPEQLGLSFDINLNLQNVDELHLNAPGLWASWFPCTDPNVLSAYVDAVRGLLGGSHRILQHHRSGRLVKSYLQRPSGQSWETIFRYRPGFGLPFVAYQTTVVQNSRAA